MSTDFSALLRALADGGVEFMLVGGLAAIVHGAARATYDVDALSLERLIQVKRAVGCV